VVYSWGKICSLKKEKMTPTKVLVSVKEVSRIVFVYFYESSENQGNRYVLKNVRKITIKHSYSPPQYFGKGYQSFKSKGGLFVYFLIESLDEEIVKINECPYCVSKFYDFQNYAKPVSSALNTIEIQGSDAEKILETIASLFKN
jgi:hypothetical protein